MYQRALAIMLTLLSLFVRTASNVCVNTDDGAFMLDRRLNPVTEAGTYDRALRAEGTELYALREQSTGLYLIADAAGQPLTRAVYEDVRGENGRVFLKRDGLWAIYDSGLNPLTGHYYTALFRAGESCFAFRTSLWDDAPDALYIIDARGSERPTDKVLLYTPLIFADGLAPATDATTGRRGYLDEEGEWMVAPELAWADAFNGALAVASLDGGSGLIDPAGDWILSPLYDEMMLGTNYVICREEGTLYVYARTDEGLIMRENREDAYASEVGAYYALYTDDYAYLCDMDGYEAAVFTGDTLIYPGLSGQVIASDMNGMYVYDVDTRRFSDFMAYIEALPRADAYRCAALGDDGAYLFGAIDTGLSTVIAPAYAQMKSPAEGLLAAGDGENIYLFALNRDGAELVKTVPLNR